MITAIKDRVILIFGFVDEVVGNQFARHALRFMFFIVGAEHFQLRAVAQLGEQALFKYVRVIGNQDVCRLQDPSGGAVVLLQLNHLQRGEVFTQQHQVLRTRAAPGVDRLVVVAYHGETGTLAHQQLYQLVLAGVGVLILIHQQVADFILPALAHLFISL